MHDSLFQPITLGAIEAPNRILMAPLTRGRADPGFVPNAMMAEYYRQRAGAGLIISEATGISREGLGWPSAPGIWTDAQVEGWKPVTEAVHAAGGRIVCQLWHMGRIVHPDFLDGELPVSSSATRAPGHAHTPAGTKDFVVARPLRLDELPLPKLSLPGVFLAAATRSMTFLYGASVRTTSTWPPLPRPVMGAKSFTGS